SNVNQYPYPQMPMHANRVRIGDKFSDLSYQQPETTDFGGQNLFNRQPVQQPYQNEYNPYNNQQGVSAYDILYSNASPLPNQYQQQEQRKEERVDSLFDQPQSNSKLFLINTNANKNLKTKSKKEMEEDKQRNAMNLLYPDKTDFDTTNPSTTRSLFEDKYASNSLNKSALFSDMFNEDLGKKDKLFNNDDYGKNVDFVNKPTHIPSNILKSDFEARDINSMKNSHLYDDKGSTQKRDFVNLGVFDKKDNNYAYDNKAEKDSAPVKVEEKKPSQADAYKKVFPTTMPKILTMSDVKKDVDEKEQDSTSKKVEEEKKRSPLDMDSPSELYTREDYENNTREIKDLLRTGKIMENNSIDIANRDYTYSYTKAPTVDPSKIKILTSLDQIEGAKPANKESTTGESSFSLLSKLKNASNVESSKAPMFNESTSKQIDELQSFTTKTYDRDDANSLIEEISKDLEVSNTGLIGVVEEKVEDKLAPSRTVNTYFQVSEPKMIKTPNGNTASQLPIIASGTYKPSVQNQETKKVDKGPIKRIKYNYPPIEYLRQSQTVNIDYSAEVEEKSRRLEHILESFDVSAKVVDTVIGPVVTRYELEIQAGTSVKKVESLTKDITMGLESPSEVIIQAPIPGKNRFGVEVPNRKRTTVSMRE
ncbi:MAG: hypothetical protein IJ981_03455, partial [Clostridia bacterium]|nr:hypothetical protein [Clostridia bacterium]